MASGFMSWLTGDVAASSPYVMMGLCYTPFLRSTCSCGFQSKGVVLTQFAANPTFCV